MARLMSIFAMPTGGQLGTPLRRLPSLENAPADACVFDTPASG